MSTVGFLSLLDQDETERFEEQLAQKRAAVNLPPYLRPSALPAIDVHLVFGPRATGGQKPSASEWDLYLHWLSDIVHAPERVRQREQRDRGKLSARLCIFLAFLRLGFPPSSIVPKNFGTDRAWRERNRKAWHTATWVDVPLMQGKSSGLALTSASYVWWAQPTAVTIPLSAAIDSLPVARVCHRMQTSPVFEDEDMQQTQFDLDRTHLVHLFLGVATEDEATRELKQRHSNWESAAIEGFINKMILTDSSESPNSSLSVDDGVSLREGILRRRSKLGGWRKRYYTLTGGNRVPGILSEYETSDSFQPKHVVYLKTATVTEAKLINGKTAGPFVFAINRRNKHPIYLKAQDQREMTSWISAMVTYTDIPNMDLDLEMFSTASLSCGENGKIIDVNPAAETLLGYRKEELVGRNVKILMPPQIAKHHNKYIREYLKTSRSKFIGKPRIVPVLLRNGTQEQMQLCVGEYFTRNTRRFFATLCAEVSLLPGDMLPSPGSSTPNSDASSSTIYPSGKTEDDVTGSEWSDEDDEELDLVDHHKLDLNNDLELGIIDILIGIIIINNNNIRTLLVSILQTHVRFDTKHPCFITSRVVLVERCSTFVTSNLLTLELTIQLDSRTSERLFSGWHSTLDEL